MNRSTSSFASKLQAALLADSWHLALDKFPFHPANLNVPTLSTQPDSRGRTRTIRADRLREICDRYRAARMELEGALAARRVFLARLEKQYGPRLRRISLVNSSRLLLHPGRPSTQETMGISWDHITGLPMIPGVAVQGMVNASACRDNHPESRKQPLAAGWPDGLVFLGAWPKTVPGLSLESVPRQGDQAAGRGRTAPSPSFFAIESGHEWDFALLAGAGVPAEETRTLLDAAESCLLEGLDQIGLGARTKAGCGRFLTAVRWAATNAANAPVSPAPSSTPAPGTSSSSPSAGDYANEAIFANRILKKLNPGAVSQIQAEIEMLRKRENASWRAKLIEALRGNEMRNVRKTLKDKAWFPQEWLP